MFRKPADFETFERVMVEARLATAAAYPFLLCFVQSLAVRGLARGGRSTDGLFPATRAEHTQCAAHRRHRTVGDGHLYQGRFKSFPVQSGDQLLSLLRYVERNPLSAGLVEKAQLWQWGSLWSRVHGDAAIKAALSPWPVGRPANWTARVNAPLTAKELDRLRPSLERVGPMALTRG